LIDTVNCVKTGAIKPPTAVTALKPCWLDVLLVTCSLVLTGRPSAGSSEEIQTIHPAPRLVVVKMKVVPDHRTVGVPEPVHDDPVQDRAGNMTTVPKPSNLSSGLTCKWDAWNHLVEVKDGTTVVAKYEYDGLARRVKKHVDSDSPSSPNGIGTYEHFFYNRGWQVMEMRRSTVENTGPESLQPEYQYVWSLRYIDAPVLRDKNADGDSLCDDDRIYYLDDANFNVTTIVDTGGDALERYVYSPYGVLTIYDATWSNIRSDSSYDIEYTYTGRRYDKETGLYYYRHRVLSAQLGRFLSRDPAGYEGGDINLSRYVRSLPTTLLDPNGMLVPNPITVVVEGLVGGGAVALPGVGLGYGLYKIPVVGTEHWLEPALLKGFEWILTPWIDEPPWDEDRVWGPVCCECKTGGGEIVRHDTICNISIRFPMKDCCDTICLMGTTLYTYYAGVCQDYENN